MKILMKSSKITTARLFFFFFLTCKPSIDGEREEDKGGIWGRGRGATVLGPNRCAVTALWKYHLSLAAKAA